MKYLIVGGLMLVATALVAQRVTPSDQPVRPIPPEGIEVPDRVRVGLEEGLQTLQESIGMLGENELRADVMVYYQAVRYALEYDEFFDEGQFATARQLLQTGQRRAEQLLRGQSPWTSTTGLVVHGYISKIDGSPQPYGLVIPESYSPTAPKK